MVQPSENSLRDDLSIGHIIPQYPIAVDNAVAVAVLESAACFGHGGGEMAGPGEVRYLSRREWALGKAVEQEAAMSVDVKRAKDFTWVWVSVAATAPTWEVVRSKVWRGMKLPQNPSSRLILQIISQKDSVFTGLIGLVVRAIHVSHTEGGSEAPARDQSHMCGNRAANIVTTM